MKLFLEGSDAIARVVTLTKPGVISAYPITPQTHIVEGLAQIVADGKLKAQFINVESEHSAASVVLGAVATGVRVYTATSSQGLLLMAEVLFNIAGMRLPLVLTCANRAVSAPINIWNDHQDSVTVRDAGWIQFYAEDLQEAVDLHIIGYRLAEDRRVSLPVMICIDGYLLTHGMEPVDIPDESLVDKYLPAYTPLYKLDPADPLTMGFLGDPTCYMEARLAIQKTHEEVLDILPGLMKEFKDVFQRAPLPMVESYRTEDAEIVIVAKGSVVGTIKEAVDELRARGKKVGAVKVLLHRPFPSRALFEVLGDIPRIAVVEKSISLGLSGPLCTEIKALFQTSAKGPNISGFIIGLGGRDVTRKTIFEIVERAQKETVECAFVDVNTKMLTEAPYRGLPSTVA